MIHACGGNNISLIIKTKNEKKVFILGPISDIRIRLSVKNRIFLLKKHTAIQIRKIYSIWFPATADSLFFFRKVVHHCIPLSSLSNFKGVY